MKKAFVVGIIALLFSSFAFADATSGATAVSGSGSQAAINAAPNVSFGSSYSKYEQEKPPASSAISPSSISQAPCQGWKSRAGSLVVASVSGGESFTISWCVAAFLGEQDVAKQILCNTDSQYRKARAQAGKACNTEEEVVASVVPGH